MTRTAAKAAAQRGFALLELAVAALIAMLLAVWGGQALVHRLNDAHAKAAAVWMEVVHKSVLAYVQQHGVEIQEATGPDALAIHGYADWRAPTLLELKHAGLLSPETPEHSPLTGAAKVTVWHRGACPGDHCMIEALVHGERPLRDERHERTDEAMLAEWLLASEGKGAAVQARDPARIRGATFAFDSMLPDGRQLPVGTVGMGITAEHLAQWSYLRVRDRRDPDFQGKLTVAGDVIGGADLVAAGSVVIHTHEEVGERCATEDAIVQDVAGGLLVCRHGRWRPGSRSSGGYGLNDLYGCATMDGVPTANPVTGSCTCPSYATATLIADSGPRDFPQGQQFTYLCVD